MKYPTSTRKYARFPVKATDSGRISRMAAASIKPAPSARKYFRYWRDHSRCRIKSPPRMLAAAAVRPSSNASTMREAGTLMDGSASIFFWRAPRFTCNVQRESRARTLAAMPEQNDVAFLDDVFLPFEAHLRAF